MIAASAYQPFRSGSGRRLIDHHMVHPRVRRHCLPLVLGRVSEVRGRSRLARGGRRLRLRLAEHWRRAADITPAITRLQTIPSDLRRVADYCPVVQHLVVALNEIYEQDVRAGEIGYETGEREDPCDDIDSSLEEAGMDVRALSARHGLSQYQITDRWRRW